MEAPFKSSQLTICQISNPCFVKFIKITFYIAIIVVVTACGAEKKKNDRDRFFLLGNEALKGNDFKEAIRLYSEALQIDNDYADAFNNRGLAHMRRDDAASALLDFNQAILIEPDNLEFLQNRAEAYAGSNRYEKALEDIRVVKKAYPDSAKVHFAEGVIHFQFQNLPEAEAAFTESLLKDSLNGEAFINRGTVRYYRYRLEEALSDLEKGLAILPSEANALNTLAMVKAAGGDFAEAYTTINKALEISSNEAYFINNKGYVLLRLDSLEEGAKLIDMALLMDPKNAWGYRNKGIFYFLSGKHQEAIKMFAQSESINAAVEDLYVWWARTLLAAGEAASACQTIQKAEPTPDATQLKEDICG